MQALVINDDFTPSAERGRLAVLDKEEYVRTYGDDVDARSADVEAYKDSGLYALDREEADEGEQAVVLAGASPEQPAREVFGEGMTFSEIAHVMLQMPVGALDSVLATRPCWDESSADVCDLSPLEERILRALVVSPSKAEAARLAGCDVSTVFAKLRDPEFVARYEGERQRFAALVDAQIADSLASGVLEAVQALRDAVGDPDADAATRVRAADCLLRHHAATRAGKR